MAGASRAAVEVEGLRELRKDLRRVDSDLPRQLNRELRQGAQPFLAEAVRTAPRSKRAAGAGRGGYKHLGDTLRLRSRGSAVQLYSRKPGANVVRFGGRHPLFGNRDHWYDQKPNPFVERAAARTEDQIGRALDQAVERAMRSAGFH